MRVTGKRSSSGLLGIGLALVLLLGYPMHAGADEGRKARNDAYLKQVVAVMRSHVGAMRMIIEHDDLRYSDNMVRHAEAFERAFGMVGPMEWHVARAFIQAQKTDAGDKLTEGQFDEMAEDTRIAVMKIKRSAARYMRDKKKDLMRGSINTMIESCDACHSRMPEGVVPEVWEGMEQ